jgi:hypothetical protein
VESPYTLEQLGRFPTEYRRSIGDLVWHYSRRCDGYPTEDYEGTERRIQHDETCQDCEWLRFEELRAAGAFTGKTAS